MRDRFTMLVTVGTTCKYSAFFRKPSGNRIRITQHSLLGQFDRILLTLDSETGMKKEKIRGNSKMRREVRT